jgi:hypothetical protein
MKFKIYFNALTKREKVLLYLIIPLLLVAIAMITNQYLIDPKLKQLNYQNNILKSKLTQLKTKNIKYIDNIKILNYIENLAQQDNISILSYKINRHIFTLEIQANYQNSLNFLLFLEHYAKIISLKISKLEQQIIININFRFITMPPSTSYKKCKIANPFFTKDKDNDNDRLKLTAIIGDNICINEKWLSINDTIGKYKILHIYKDYVELIYKNNIIKLTLVEDNLNNTKEAK